MANFLICGKLNRKELAKIREIRGEPYYTA
jgi:hypothetical protein